MKNLSEKLLASFFAILLAGMSIFTITYYHQDSMITEVSGEEVAPVYEDDEYTITEIQMLFKDRYDVVVNSIDYAGSTSWYETKSNTIVLKQLTDKSIQTDYEGTILVSYDLNKAVIEKNEDGSITVTLPAAKILSNEVTLTNTKSEDSLLSSDISEEDFANLRNKIAEEELTEAINNGLYDKAKVNVEKDMTSTIQAVAGEDVVINFNYK